MTITIRLLQPADIPHYLALNITAFRETSSLGHAIHPNGWSPARTQQRIDEWTKDITSKPQFHLLAAHDDELNDEIIAGARWEREEEGTCRKPDAKEELPEEKEFPFDKQIAEAFMAMISGLHYRAMRGKSCWHLHLLFSNLAHGRRGAGTKLVQWGIERADAEGLPCYLDATVMGKPLYERLGFQVKEAAELDLKQYGKEGVVTCCSMVRPAKTKADIEAAVSQEERSVRQVGEDEPVGLTVLLVEA